MHEWLIYQKLRSVMEKLNFITVSASKSINFSKFQRNASNVVIFARLFAVMANLFHCEPQNFTL